jgi:uncharacterized protein (DUF2236 family)
MNKQYFVEENSIVREIWGKSDTILFIFAGASAEFALNKAVDWLYFTGKLPSDPLARLFSTVSYARAIVFSEKQAAHRAIDSMAAIHGHVESKRGAKIPDWAYRDVLFMLIDYSIRSYEVLERELTRNEKSEVFQVFNTVGLRMGISGLPETFEMWEKMRQSHLAENMQRSIYTDDLFKQYHKHLGDIRYKILIEAQTLVVPQRAKEMLGLRKMSLLPAVITFYKLFRFMNIDWILKELILPSNYKKEIKQLDRVTLSVG